MAHWVSTLDEQALVLHDQIAAARAAELSQNIDLSSVIRLYREKLAELYSDQFPLASLMDSSDLIVRAKGPSAKEHASVSSAVAWLCGEMDRRLRQLGMAALGLTGESAMAAGHDLRVLLNGLAPGSLYLGFSLSSEHADEESEQFDIDDGTDSLALSTVREAVRELPLVPRFVGSENVDREIMDAIEDPVVRDAMLMAAYHLAPTGKRGIHTLEISSPGTMERSSFLTNRERVVLRETAVRTPMMKRSREGTFVGVCREVDLDARRFQLRHVQGGIPSLRCVISQLTAETARKFIGKGVKVRGHYEAGPDNRPRLLQVESIEPYQIQSELLQSD
jgi:hypothetical protein